MQGQVKATRAGGKTKASSGLIARAISTGCHICMDGLVLVWIGGMKA